jgi:hypothetical protein
MVLNKEDTEWLLKQQKQDMINKCENIIKRSKLFIILNIIVGIFDFVWAIFFINEPGTIYMIFKIMLIGLGIGMFYLVFNNYRIIKKAKELLPKIQISKYENGEWV